MQQSLLHYEMGDMDVCALCLCKNKHRDNKDQ